MLLLPIVRWRHGRGWGPSQCHMSHCPMLPFLSMSASPALSTMSAVRAVLGVTSLLAGGSTVTRRRQAACCVACTSGRGRAALRRQAGMRRLLAAGDAGAALWPSGCP